MLAHAYLIEITWFVEALVTVLIKLIIVKECWLDWGVADRLAGTVIGEYVARNNFKTEFYRLVVNCLLLFFMTLTLVNPPPANSGEFLDSEQLSWIRLTLLVYTTTNLVAVYSYYHTRRKTQAYVDNDKTVQSVRPRPD